MNALAQAIITPIYRWWQTISSVTHLPPTLQSRAESLIHMLLIPPVITILYALIPPFAASHVVLAALMIGVVTIPSVWLARQGRLARSVAYFATTYAASTIVVMFAFFTGGSLNNLDDVFNTLMILMFMTVIAASVLDPVLLMRVVVYSIVCSVILVLLWYNGLAVPRPSLLRTTLFTPIIFQTVFGLVAYLFIRRARHFQADIIEKKRLLEAIVQKLPIGVVVFELGQDAPVFSNALVVEYVGPFDATQDQITREWLPLRTSDQPAHEKSQMAFSQNRPWAKVLASGKAYEGFVRLTFPDRKPRHIYEQALPITSAQGEIRYVLYSAGDVTTLREMLQTASQVQHEKAPLRYVPEADLSNSRVQLLYQVGNDLRRPLSTVVGRVDLMLDEAQKGVTLLPEGTVLDLHAISHGLNDALFQVNNLMEATRLEAPSSPLLRSKIDLVRLLTDMVEGMESIFRQKGLRLGSMFPVEHLVLQANEQHIRQIVYNLLSNALKYTERGNVTVSLQLTRRDAEVSVSDTGVGVPDDKLDLIFNRFSATGTESTQGRGIGLGLNIARELTKRHGGQLWVESRMGIGSTFSFTIPLVSDDDY